MLISLPILFVSCKLIRLLTLPVFQVAVFLLVDGILPATEQLITRLKTQAILIPKVVVLIAHFMPLPMMVVWILSLNLLRYILILLQTLMLHQFVTVCPCNLTTHLLLKTESLLHGIGILPAMELLIIYMKTQVIII